MAKATTSKAIEDVKNALKAGKAVLGTERTIKQLKLGKLSKVFVTSNCPEDIKSDIQHYAKLANIEVVQLKQPNDELGTLCKKPFAISVISIK
ncbi:50S ribosomal protein L30e [Candidatus Woesearchaeota archaeon]|nr:50S ribosomal protein L30e [Candidatus Woesearchaeota archaeon]MBW3021341.1 50S ribosomal protein L30e [Candidatus Woesearchaeota archaeon]